MSVTALDLAVVTIESLVARDISDFSSRRARGAALQAPAHPASAAPGAPGTTAAPWALALPVLAAGARPALAAPAPVSAPASEPITADKPSSSAPAHPHHAPASRRLAQVH